MFQNKIGLKYSSQGWVLVLINIIGPYEILDKIGHGGMGVVYRAIHKKIEKEVAIKAIPPQLSQDSKTRKRFLNEARLQAKLSHPNIVNVINYIESEDSIYLIMEYVKGETLEERIKREGFLEPEKAVEISEKILDALEYLHNKGIVHRDLKPSNIMFTQNGRVKVTDFGISKLVGKKGLTTTMLAGSYTYLSPEEITGQGTTYSSDIYSYGVTLYQMLAGKVPFDYDSEYRIMKAHLEEKPKDIRKHNPKVPFKLSMSVLKAISKDPKSRYKTPAEFKEKLLESLTSEKFYFDFLTLKNYSELIGSKLKPLGLRAVPIAVFFIFIFASVFLFFRKPEESTANFARDIKAESIEKKSANIISNELFLNSNPKLSSYESFSPERLIELSGPDEIAADKTKKRKYIKKRRKAPQTDSVVDLDNKWKIRK